MTAPEVVECPGCGRPVLHVDDRDTLEQLVVDAEPLPLATVEVFRAGPALAARRRGLPGAAPVHAEHDCDYARAHRDLAHRQAVDVAQAPDDPGLEQAGWRAP